MITTLNIDYIGYSTFVVVPTDPENPLPRSDADVIATTLPRSTSSGPQHLSTVRTPQPPAGLEDEDLQLQVALQASLGEAGDVSWEQEGSSITAGGVSTLTPSAGGFPPSSLLASPPPIPPPSTRPADQQMESPVAASMARNRAFLERMRQEQEAALREHYHDEAANLGDDQPRQSSFEARNTVEDEDELLRRAIEESAEMARKQGLTKTDNESAAVRADPEAVVYTGENTQGPPLGDRVYDDEDAELQAALQASLGESVPGFISPDSSTESSPFTTASVSSARSELSSSTLEDDDAEGDTATEETGSDTAERSQPARNVSIEEMRRRRLERFGG